MRVFNQWRIGFEPGTCKATWTFVPLSIWATEDFCGFVILNFCFELPRTKLARDIHGAMSGL